MSSDNQELQFSGVDLDKESKNVRKQNQSVGSYRITLEAIRAQELQSSALIPFHVQGEISSDSTRKADSKEEQISLKISEDGVDVEVFGNIPPEVETMAGFKEELEREINQVSVVTADKKGEKKSFPIHSKKDIAADLQIAIVKNNFPKLQALVQSGININDFLEKDDLALHRLFSLKDFRIFEYLISENLNPNITVDGLNLLEKVASSGWNSDQKKQILRKLKEKIAAPDDWAYVEAAIFANIEKLKEKKKEINLVNPEKPSLLLYAAANDQLKTVQWLIEHGGSNISERDKKGTSALLYAAGCGHLRTVKWLLNEGGASIIERNIIGWSALHIAAANGHFETVKWLLEHGGANITERDTAAGSALLIASANSHFEIVKLLLKHGSNIDEHDKFGGSALLYAAANGPVEMVQWLLKYGGANISERDNARKSALLYAASKGELATVQWLLSNEGGASITERDQNGMSALLYAAKFGHYETVRWLLKSGKAKISERDNEGRSALLLATEYGSLATVWWLLKHGEASIAEHYKDWSVLFTASAFGHREIMEWLLTKEGGCSITERNNLGQSALHVAAMNGQVETMEWLLTKKVGACIHECDKDGVSAFYYAVAAGHENLALILIKKYGAYPNLTINGRSFLSIGLNKNIPGDIVLRNAKKLNILYEHYFIKQKRKMIDTIVKNTLNEKRKWEPILPNVLKDIVINYLDVIEEVSLDVTKKEEKSEKLTSEQLKEDADNLLEGLRIYSKEYWLTPNEDQKYSQRLLKELNHLKASNTYNTLNIRLCVKEFLEKNPKAIQDLKLKAVLRTIFEKTSYFAKDAESLQESLESTPVEFVISK
jgi:ankyrin repeat protein